MAETQAQQEPTGHRKRKFKGEETQRKKKKNTKVNEVDTSALPTTLKTSKDATSATALLLSPSREDAGLDVAAIDREALITQLQAQLAEKDAKLAEKDATTAGDTEGSSSSRNGVARAETEASLQAMIDDKDAIIRQQADTDLRCPKKFDILFAKKRDELDKREKDLADREREAAEVKEAWEDDLYKNDQKLEKREKKLKEDKLERLVDDEIHKQEKEQEALMVQAFEAELYHWEKELEKLKLQLVDEAQKAEDTTKWWEDHFKEREKEVESLEVWYAEWREELMAWENKLQRQEAWIPPLNLEQTFEDPPIPLHSTRSPDGELEAEALLARFRYGRFDND